jgi:hypothetical protein
MSARRGNHTLDVDSLVRSNLLKTASVDSLA